MRYFPKYSSATITKLNSPVWNTTMNRLGRHSYLRELAENGTEIPAYAAPARNQDFAGLPPTITFVGDKEPFYRETENYVKGLKEAGIDVTYKLYEGCYHGFDLSAGDKGVSRDAIDFTLQSYAEFYDKYLVSD